VLNKLFNANTFTFPFTVTSFSRPPVDLHGSLIRREVVQEDFSIHNAILYFKRGDKEKAIEIILEKHGHKNAEKILTKRIKSLRWNIKKHMIPQLRELIENNQSGVQLSSNIHHYLGNIEAMKKMRGMVGNGCYQMPGSERQ